jgi:hypothetical protein
LGDLEREKREGFQQQILHALCIFAKDQRREQELDHGGSKAFGGDIELIFLLFMPFLICPRPLYVCSYYINIKGKVFFASFQKKSVQKKSDANQTITDWKHVKMDLANTP